MTMTLSSKCKVKFSQANIWPSHAFLPGRIMRALGVRQLLWIHEGKPVRESRVKRISIGRVAGLRTGPRILLEESNKFQNCSVWYRAPSAEVWLSGLCRAAWSRSYWHLCKLSATTQLTGLKQLALWVVGSYFLHGGLRRPWRPGSTSTFRPAAVRKGVTISRSKI